MKQKLQNTKIKAAGFTVIELLVVLAIFAVLIGLFMVNFAGLRGPRNLRIAQNELSSSIRKVQSYVLSARSIPVTGNPAPKFYIMKFRLSTTTGYVIQAVDSTYTSYPSIESPTFPKGISYQSTPPGSLFVTDLDGTNIITNPLCVQVVFALPFGRIYIDDVASGTDCNISPKLNDPGYLASISNRIFKVTLKDPASLQTRSVILNGVTGTVTMQ